MSDISGVWKYTLTHIVMYRVHHVLMQVYRELLNLVDHMRVAETEQVDLPEVNDIYIKNQ